MKQNRLPRWLRHRRLSLRVVLVILLISSLFTLMIAGYQLHREYQRDLNRLDSRLSEVESSLSSSLGSSVWSMDPNQVTLQLRGILQLPDVRQVEITGDIAMQLGEVSDYPHQVIHRIPVRYTLETGETRELGEVVISADLREIHARLWDRALLILVAQGLKTFTVSLLILAAFYYLVTRHLKTLSRFARRLRLDRLDMRPELHRTGIGLLRPDELDDVTDAFGHAMERIRADVAARENAELERDLLARALEQSPAGVLILDADGRVDYLNPRLVEFSGCEPDDVRGREAFGPRGWLEERVTVPKESGDPWSQIREGGEWQSEIRFRREDGHFRWAWVSLRPVGEAGERYYIALIEDTTQLRIVQERLDFHTHFDTLTELPNRLLAWEHLGSEIRRSSEESRTALLFLDLDNFKYVNDSLGHETGDRLLVEVADRLRRLSDPEWIPARFGSDEFLAIIPGVGDTASLGRRVESLMTGLREPVVLDGERFFVSVTGGIALAPDAGSSARELLQAADTALYAAKQERKNSLRFYEPAQRQATRHRLTMEGDLRQALAEGQFELHYQPVIGIATGDVVGVEALIRWRHPDRELVPPDEFIPVAEENGLIVPIGEWVLRTALLDLASLQRSQGNTELSMAVNVSARQLMDEAFMTTMESALDQAGIDGSRLQLELTERLLVKSFTHTRRALSHLERLGVQLVIDDFGTGYSALSYLRRLNVHALKVDREFVRDIGEDEDDALLTRAIVSMAHDLEILVVAEGVETEQQLHFLREAACEHAQGFYFARPMPYADLEQYLTGMTGSGADPGARPS